MQGRNALEVKWDFGPAAKESSAGGCHEQFPGQVPQSRVKIVRRRLATTDSVLASSPLEK